MFYCLWYNFFIIFRMVYLSRRVFFVNFGFWQYRKAQGVDSKVAPTAIDKIVRNTMIDLIPHEEIVSMLIPRIRNAIPAIILNTFCVLFT